MSKTKQELKEEIARLRARSATALEAEEYKAEAIALEKELESRGIPLPSSLMAQIRRIEEQYLEEILRLAKLCSKQTGRTLNIAIVGRDEDLI